MKPQPPSEFAKKARHPSQPKPRDLTASDQLREMYRSDPVKRHEEADEEEDE